MNAEQMLCPVRKIAFASALLAAVASSGQTLAAEFAPLPGDPGAPRVELGKVNIFSLDELPPDMQQEARATLRLRRLQAFGDLDFEPIDEDDWRWPLPNEALFPDHASMNQGLVMIEPRDLSGTEFANLSFLGIADNDAHPGETVHSITRHFVRQDGVLITLTENQFDQHGAVVLVRELIRDRVDNWPASFSVERAPSGRVRSVLDWAVDGSDFTLMVLDDVRRPAVAGIYDKAWLFKLAQSIQHAPRLKIPAQPVATE